VKGFEVVSEKLLALQNKLSKKSIGQPIPKSKPELLYLRCPSCKKGVLETVPLFDQRGQQKNG